MPQAGPGRPSQQHGRSCAGGAAVEKQRSSAELFSNIWTVKQPLSPSWIYFSLAQHNNVSPCRYPQQVACPPKSQLPGYAYSNSVELENKIPHNTHQGGFTPFQKVQYTPTQCSTSHAVYSTHAPTQKPGSHFGSMVSNPTPGPTHTQAAPAPFTPHGLTQKTQVRHINTLH